MEENKTIFNYIGQTFSTFGVIVALFIILGCIVGDSAGNYSTLFALGKQGFSMNTLFQLLLMSATISLGHTVFLTDRWIKNMPLLLRNICFFLTVIIAAVCFSCVFSWFPIDNIDAWIGFLISFAICSVAGIVVGRLKEQTENRKMAKTLDRIRQEENGIRID